MNTENPRIIPDHDEVQELKSKFPTSTWKLELDNILKRFNNSRHENPLFDQRTDEIFLNTIKRSITLIDTQFKEPSPPPPPPAKIFTVHEQVKEFIKNQPLFYDKSGLWWVWHREELFWELTDEIHLLNLIDEQVGANIIGSKIRGEILNGLKQEGRKNTPKDAPNTWIQFKNGIVDIDNPHNLFSPNSSYFITNPIDWNVGKTEETPVMDKIFAEWVGEEMVQTLYEVIAYCLIPDYPLHRIFCFIGSGMNGKSKYLDLLRKFVGKKNCASTELDTLIGSRFEVARLHKKLVCIMGETNFGELSKTSMLKKLSGGDLIGFEYKNKNPFEDINYAKIIISTNNLPTTTDKTIGFYRRWMIIDFPNTFTELKDILKDIPEQEYSNLSLKCIGILQKILKERVFHKEGSVEERMERYEARSNFIDAFVKTYTQESFEGHITKSDFYKKFVAWSKENRHRIMSETSVGMAMKKMGIANEKKFFDWMFDGKGGQVRVWGGIEWK